MVNLLFLDVTRRGNKNLLKINPIKNRIVKVMGKLITMEKLYLKVQIISLIYQTMYQKMMIKQQKKFKIVYPKSNQLKTYQSLVTQS